MFIQYLFTDFQYFYWWILIAVGSVCLHELFHALAAYWEGDSTAKELGYFTLNPMKHMGGASLLLLLFTGMCWGLCPVNPSKFRHRYGDALVSFAGPFANLLIMIASGLSIVLLASLFQHDMTPAITNLMQFLQLATVVNAAFFILNLLPIPPLDGHGIFSSFFPASKPFYQNLGNAGFILIFLIFSIPAARSLFWKSAETLSQGNLVLWSGLLGF